MAAKLPFETPLVRPRFPRLDGMKAWIDLRMPHVELMTDADSELYQKVRGSYNQRVFYQKKTKDAKTGKAAKKALALKAQVRRQHFISYRIL